MLVRRVNFGTLVDNDKIIYFIKKENITKS